MKNKNAYLKDIKNVTYLNDLKKIIKPNDKGRALLAVAILDDESIRLASQANSRAYLKRKQDEDTVPFWIWCILYFTLGILFMISVENIFWNIKDLVI